MTTAQETLSGLLQGILDYPGEIHRRLIYADALEESGNRSRAEFIRHYASGKKYDASFDAELCNWCRGLITTRDYELEKRQLPSNEFISVSDSDTWITDNTFKVKYYWSGGFLSVIDCALSQWMKDGPQIIREHPLRMVRVTDKRPHDGGWELPAITTWWNQDRDNAMSDDWQSDLPEAIFMSLKDRVSQKRSVRFYSIEEAFTALSHACIVWAKSAR